MKIDRLLSIVIILLNREKISAVVLAKKFEVSVRTIYRDIEAINLAGVPIISYPGNNGGFGIVPNYKIDKQILSLNDMISILTALKGINATLDDRSLDNAIEKITNLVPQNQADNIINNIVFDIKPWSHAKKHTDKMKSIYNSIINLNLIKFDYIDRNEKPTLRIVEPVCLVYKGFGWYLIGFCKKKNDIRIFRLSGIKKLEITDEKFIKKYFDYNEYTKQTTENLKYIKMILKFSPKVRNLIDDYLEYTNLKVCDDGYLQVEVNIPEGDWFYSILLSYGDYVEVIEPDYIKKIIIEKAKNILKIYQP